MVNPPLRSSPVEDALNCFGYVAFESRHGKTFSMPPTLHHFPKLLLIQEGRGRVVSDGGEIVCETGDCAAIPAGVEHRVIDDSNHPISLYGLGVAASLFDCVPGILQQIPFVGYPSHQLIHLGVQSRLRRILYLDSQTTASTRLACIAASLDLFAELAMLRDQSAPLSPLLPTERVGTTPINQTTDPLLKTYIDWLEHHFFEMVTLDTAAERCGMSRRHFTNQFKQATGTTWLHYVHQLRARHACELLRTTERKVTSVAFECGFDDLTTFYRVIGRLTGLRPGDFRRQKNSSLFDS